MNIEKTILIVDDSESIRELISSTLEGEGYIVRKCVNGEEGIKELDNFQDLFHLIITDLNMPIMDGLTFLKNIRQIENYQYVPILILTTESNIDMRNEAKSAGATGWIVKPFDSNKLLNVVRKVIR